MKKVVIVIPGLYFGGMERVALIAREILLKNGYDVRIVTLFTGEPDYEPDFQYVSLGCEVSGSKIGKVVTSIKRILRMRAYKRQECPDYLIAFGKSANFVNVFSGCGEEIIVGIRSYDWLESSNYGQFVEKMVYMLADKVVSVSKLIQQDAEKKYGIDRSKSFYLYNPYDLSVINERASEYISEHSIPEDNVVIVSAGRLENQKGYYHLIKAISLIEDKKNLSVYILGHGSKEDKLKSLIKELKLEQNVFLIGGQKNPYKYMKRADIYVMPSISEGFPNALVEAMAIGTPVISADCLSGPREILTEKSIYERTEKIELGEYGILVQAMTDSKAYTGDLIEECDRMLAEAIQQLMNNDGLRIHYGRVAKKRAELFSYEMFEEQLLKILRN